MNPTILAALALVATVSWVQSATVVFSARGHVTGALGTVYSPAGLGSEVEVLVTYDEPSTDLDVSPAIARYQPGNFSLALSLIGGPTIFQTSAAQLLWTPCPGHFLPCTFWRDYPTGMIFSFCFVMMTDPLCRQMHCPLPMEA